MTWKSSDPEIATVDENGLVTTYKTGNVTITGTPEANPEMADFDVISVNPVQVSEITIGGYSKEYMLPKETVQLSASVKPDNAEDKELTWTSSNSEIAKVDSNGKVTAVKQGDVTIRVENKASGKYAEQKIKVYDTKPKTATIQVWVTNQNQNKSYTINLPADGTEVNASDVLKKVDGYVSMNVIRVGSWSSGSNWTTIQQTNPVQKFRYKGGSVQYTTNGTNWVNVNSRDSIIAFYGIKRTAVLDKTDVGVVIGDWPYGDNDGYGHNKHTIRIQMVVDGSGTEIYNSGKMRYDNNQNQALGKIEFNCDESRYEIKKIYVYNNDAGTGSPVQTYDAVPAGGISVKFDTQQENHYLVKAVVKPKEFTVSYDINGGTGDVPATTKLTAVNNQQVTVASSPQPTKEKYIFAGWEYNGTTYYGGESFEMPPRNVTFKAKWIPEGETITYHSNNEAWGTVNRSYENLKSGATTTKGANAKAAEGCIFVGWKNSKGEFVSENSFYRPEAKAGSYTAVFKANINKYLSLETKDAEKKYDGTALTSGTAQVIGKVADADLEGVTIYYQDVKGGDWVTDPSKITAKNVEDSTTVNVKVTSDKYNGELTGTQTVTIKKAEVTLKSETLTKQYDGKALVNGDKALATEKGWAEGEGADYTFTGSQTVVGSSANSFTYKAKAGTNFNNYEITANSGTLTVTSRDAKYEITVKANSTTGTYNGTEYSAIGLESTAFTVDGNVYTVEGLTTEDPVKKDAGTYTNNITGTAVVKDAAGNDVSSEFAVSTENGSLKIKKAEVTLKSATLTKQYDGDALVNGNTALEIESGWAEGEGADYHFTGSQTLVGSSENTFTYTAREGTNFNNYTIKPSNGTLTVTNRDAKYELTVKANSTKATYDGKKHKAEGVETYEFTINNHKYTVSGLKTEDPEHKNAGTYTNNITGTAVVTDEAGNDVSSEFLVKTEDGSLKINKAKVTLKSADLNKKYDGKALVNGDKALATETGWAEGEGADYTFTGSQTVVGSSANSFTYKAKAGTNFNNYEITANSGTLTVTSRDAKYEITVKANSTTGTYNGTEYSAIGLESTAFTVDGNVYTVEGLTTEDPVKKDAGTYTNNITGTAVVKDAAGNDVSSEFAVSTENGSLKIKKAEVTLKSATLTKQYDGDALVNGNAALEIESGWAEGEGADYHFTGSQTLVGSSENTFTYTAREGTNFNNYTIKPSNGTLTVTNRDAKYELTVKANSTKATYDGKKHKAEGVETYEFTINNHKYTVSGLKTEDPEHKNAGTYTNNITGTAVVTDEAGNDVSSEFLVKTEDGSLKINKAKVTLKSADLNKKYDGKALVNGDKALATETGWAEGEGADYTFTGSQTVVGSSANSFTYKAKAGTNFNNYEITANSGTLTVTSRDAKYEITVKANSTTGTYNGTEYSAIGLESTAFTVDGNVYTVEGLTTEDPVKKDAGTYTNNITGTAVVKDAAGNDVSSEFAVSTENGNLKIKKAEVTLKSATLSKVYDGKALVNGDTALETEEGWAEADKASVVYNFTGSQIYVGSSENTFSVEWNETVKESNYNVAIDYGTLTVTPQSIVPDPDPENPSYKGVEVSTPSDVPYNGQDQTWQPTVTDADGVALVNGQDYTVSYDKDDRTNVTGIITVTITGTGNYTGAVTRTYQITPKAVTITTNSAEKTFDNIALKTDGSVEGIVEGETYSFTVTGSQTWVGSSANTYEMVWATEDNHYTAKQSNYAVSENVGTLTVTDGTPETPIDPSLVVNKTHDKNQTYKAGDEITFTITVKNIYDEVKTITLAEQEGVTLNQDVFEDVQPGAEITATATYTVTEADIVNGTFTNNVKATFSGVDKEYTGMDTVDKFEESRPHMTITKVTKDAGEDHIYKLGETINYVITVKNDGNLTLTNVKIEDALTGNAGENAWTIDTFAPGETQTFETSYVVTEADVIAGKVVNNATGEAENPDPKKEETPVTPGEKEDPVETPNPGLTVIKTSDKTGEVKLGDKITYTITVTNNGNVTISGVKLNDSLTGDNWTLGDIKPGEIVTRTTTYTVTEADILAGKIENHAIAAGKDPNGNDITDEGEKTVTTEESKPHITVTKETTSTPKNGETYALGEEITYKITAKNDGNLTLTNVTVEDELTGNTGDKAFKIDGEFKPGDEKSFETSYTVKESDLGTDGKGSVLNVATATGTTPDEKKPKPGVDPGKTEDPTDQKKPSMSIEKKVIDQKEKYEIGDTVKYEITVTNTGNTTQNNILVEDQMSAAGQAVITKVDGANGTIDGVKVTLDTLAPGKAATITAEYTVVKADRGKTITNAAVATGEGEIPKTPDVPVDVEDVYDIHVVHAFAPGNEGNVALPDDYTIENLKPKTVKSLMAKGVTGYVAYPAAQNATVVDRDITVTFLYYKDEIGTDPTNPDKPDGVPDEFQRVVRFVAVNGTVSIDHAVVTLFGEDGKPAKNGVGHLSALQIAAATANAGYNQASLSWAPQVPTMDYNITGDMTFTATFTATPVTPPATPDNPRPNNPTRPSGQTTEPTGNAFVDNVVTPVVETVKEKAAKIQEVFNSDDEDVPLADQNLDNHKCCILHFLIMLITLLVYALATKSMKKRQKKLHEVREELDCELARRGLPLSREKE